MAKKCKGKKGGDYWDEDFETDAPQAEEFGTPAPTEEGNGEEEESKGPSGPTEAGEDDFGGDFMATLKKNKEKKAKAAEEKPKNGGGNGPVVKSKKEKEKEKKEKEKQRKKEMAAKKKANAAANKGTGSQSVEADESKAKAEKEAKAKAEKEAADAKAKADANKAKGKKVPAGIAALRRQLELKKQAEEEEARLIEEEERLLKEEEAKLAEQEKEKEAARAAKKERERAKKEQLKAEGKLLTKKQKEEKRAIERRREQLLASGAIVGGLQKESGETSEAPKPKKVVYGKKKKSTKTPEQEKAEKEAAEAAKKAAEAAKADEEGDDDALVDDWEKMALEDDEPLADDWEAAAEDKPSTASTSEETPEAEEVEEEKEEEVEAEVSNKEALAAQKAKEEAELQAKAKEAEEKLKQAEKYSKKASKQQSSGQGDLRSPICVILGHVDTGKTKLLDKIRQTNVQGGEAGGITQQIGATYFPIEAIKTKTAVMAAHEKQTFDVPGLLIIDTPGHESFSNLRSRGSSLCNIAVLVIDIMHGLEQQTLESIKLLRDRKTPFVVALNKIDRLYDWQTTPNNSFRDSFSKQTRSVQQEFDDRYTKIKVALAEQGLNSELYFQNRNMSKYVSIVPTSAVTGEGVPDLLWLLLELTQKRMSKQLMYITECEATILEVKVIEGLGTTIDVILSNGYLREGDRIVLCGMNGPIATNVRALLTPQPLRELRLKSEYVHHKEVKAALGVKIAANDLEKAVAGSRLIVVNSEEEEEDAMDEVMDDLTGLLDSVDTSGRGVTVQASTLGSLEALLDFLKDMKIPVMSIGLGPIYKRDVMKATTMLDKAKEYAVMLCFDVKVDKEAQQYADEQGIQMFTADVIYHLFDAFTAYQQKLLEQRRKDFLEYAIYPVVLKTVQIINKRNPMIIGVDVVEGTLRIGTPICAVKIDPETKQKATMLLGRVVSLEVNHKSVDIVKKNTTSAGVAMRLENPSSAQPVWGRHVDEKDNLYSLITRRSIDTLKDPAFRDQVTRDDWLLLKSLKPIFDIK
ncbi:Eukaryotic translation initiation factor 5B [Wickerhamomyces ciferrii]|uniref:Eukaryotic translation initiation factor 5B n=1 Tax=Wickerhamomyces ciferrii (strain ATCC 14091 / BCRC 22168 / CBS 111 / JCM 3599 / NBRC 0793 / NRRL Y-1031 F-60-10) TaxID=1206466 RepID=K0KHA3_WICCF|nr:Eukaryotic translation initiation factor 5B [Wickerhamomyces ciferrii]CCH40548.1 Eukaryotic translation initiation factor 5B [Wickerhamomyces ciferrii]